MQGEGIATITANALAKDAPHPNTAKLFYRWAASEEGQKVFAEGGRLPPHPKVEPVEKIRPAVLYPIGTEEIKGNDVVKATGLLLKADHERGKLNFFGNVEGNAHEKKFGISVLVLLAFSDVSAHRDDE